ncbi:MAG: hypothetical protein Q9195_008941 [Heterodermia aff. obscurata]
MAAIARIRLPVRSSVTSIPSAPLLPLCAHPTSQLLRPSKSTHLAAQRPRTLATSKPSAAKKYTKDHEWIELSSDSKTGTIGISNYASKALGDVVYVELPTIPLTVSQGDTIGAVESVKSASDIISPASGTIIEANNVLEEKPAVINKGPEGEGWLAKIELNEEGGGEEYEALMDEEGYAKYVEE